MSKILILNSPTLEVVDLINKSDIDTILTFVLEKNGDISFLSSCIDISFLTYAKLEIEKEITNLINNLYSEQEGSDE